MKRLLDLNRTTGLDRSVKSAFPLVLKLGVVFAWSVIFFVWIAPWRLVEIGPDEGMVFARILLLLRLPQSVATVWNDQTWFYTKIYASIFAFTGFQFWIPRLATLVLACALCCSFPRLMPRGAGLPHWIFAWIFFWSFPGIPQLSVSSMVEIPTFALAVIAASLMPRSRSEFLVLRFIGCGALLATAVQIKPSALLVVPPILFASMSVLFAPVAQVASERISTGSPTPYWLGPVLGLSAFAVVFALIELWIPRTNFVSLWRIHTVVSLTPEARNYSFHPLSLFGTPGTIAAALLGIVLLLRRQRMREIAFPISFLATVFFVHLIYHPWWYFYNVHFAIPLAIIAGWGGGEMFRMGVMQASNRAGRRFTGPTVETPMMLASLIIAMWVGFELPNAFHEATMVKSGQSVSENDVLKELNDYRGRVKWAFSQLDRISLVHAGYLQPPELTILSKKRFWSGDFDQAQVLKTVDHYQCEILILSSNAELREQSWQQFLQREYVLVWANGDENMFVAKRLNPHPLSERREFLKNLK